MRGKLTGYFLLSFFSFCFFTVIFHALANAQTPVVQISQTVEKEETVPTPTIFLQLTIFPTETPEPTSTPIPTDTPIPTAIPTSVPTVAVAVDLETLFAKFSEEYQADKELLKRIARCESGFNPEAVNGIYAGMFQFAPQSWVSVRNGMGLDTKTDLRTNVEESIRTAAYMIGHGQASAWPSCR